MNNDECEHYMAIARLVLGGLIIIALIWQGKLGVAEIVALLSGIIIPSSAIWARLGGPSCPKLPS